MKLKLLILGVALFLAVPKSHAQWTVVDPTNLVQNITAALKTGATATNTINAFEETVKIYNQAKGYYDALRQVKNLVSTARKVQKTLVIVLDISDIYVEGFRRMASDPNYTSEELSAIAHGYSILLEEAGNVLSDLKSIVNENGLSMNDAERLNIIDKCYDKVYEYRALTQYFTNKTIGVSWLRAKKKNDTDRVMALYGNPADRYW